MLCYLFRNEWVCRVVNGPSAKSRKDIFLAASELSAGAELGLPPGCRFGDFISERASKESLSQFLIRKPAYGCDAIAFKSPKSGLRFI